jgi:uncharacterized protein
VNQQYMKLSVYINEGDEWQHKPLHLEVMRMFREQGMSGGTVVRAVAGFTAKDGVKTSALVDAGGKLPLVIEMVETAENIQRILPMLKEMAPHRLIIRQEVEVE